MQPQIADLSNEPLLKSAQPITMDGRACPSLSGIALISKLGTGAAGTTYFGLQPLDRGCFAVKVFPNFPDAERERSMRLLIDAKSAMDVRSPHLVRLHSFGTEGGLFYQIQEFVEGQSAQQALTKIRERLKPGLDENVVLELGSALAEGVAAAHAMNLLHRNLRPSSILIPRQAGGEGYDFANAKVTDLGLAFNEPVARMLEDTPARTGIPGILSPEQAMGDENLKAASDVFSIGATLYTLLVGQPPFGGFNLNLVLSATIINEAGDLRTWRPDVSRALARVIALCLKKNIGERFPDAGVVLKGLKICRAATGKPLEQQVAALAEIDALIPPPKQQTSKQIVLKDTAPANETKSQLPPEERLPSVVTPEIAAAETSASAPAVTGPPPPAAPAPLPIAAAAKPGTAAVAKKGDILEDALNAPPPPEPARPLYNDLPPKLKKHEGTFGASAFLPAMGAMLKSETALFNDLLGRKAEPPKPAATNPTLAASAAPPSQPPIPVPPPPPPKSSSDEDTLIGKALTVTPARPIKLSPRTSVFLAPVVPAPPTPDAPAPTPIFTPRPPPATQSQAAPLTPPVAVPAKDNSGTASVSKATSAAVPPPPPPAPEIPASKPLPSTAIIAKPMDDVIATPVPVNSGKYSAAQEWDDPTVLAPMDSAAVTPAPRRSAAGALAIAAVLLLTCGAGAWYLNLLPPELTAALGLTKPAAKPKPNVPGTDPLPPDLAKPPQPPPLSPEEQAKVDAESQKRKAELEAEQKRADEARRKAEEEYREAQARMQTLKTEREAQLRAAEARLKQEAEAKAKADAELKAKLDKVDDERRKAEELERIRFADERKAELARAKIEAEAKAKADAVAREKAEAEAKARVDSEKRAAELKAKADAEAKTQAAAAAELKAKEDADKRAAEVKAKAKVDAEAKAKADREKNASKPKAESTPLESLPRELSINLGDGVSMEFVLVPPGNYLMGMDAAPLDKLTDGEGNADETPAHRVQMNAFYIGKTPVTIAQFRRFIAASEFKTSAERYGEAYTLAEGLWKRTPGASWMRPGFRQDDDHPVVMLSLRDCDAFAQWIAGQSGKPMRLPTEEEWEYAARGPQNTLFPWGEKFDPGLANHADTKLKAVCQEKLVFSKWSDGFAFTSPVGAFNNKSWCGAYDMAGNVLQWCATPYEKYPPAANAPRIIADPEDAPDAKRVLRGGSYLFKPIDLRSTGRRNLSPRAWSCELGMRLAFTPQ